MTTRHPDSALLLDYAAGSLVEPVALAVACHACHCTECRATLDRMTAVGGEMLRRIEPVPESIDPLLDATLARLDEPEPPLPMEPALDAETTNVLPPPLRPYAGANLDQLDWKWRGPSMREAPLRAGVRGYRVSLFRLPPDGAVPPHGHHGNEYTVILQGILCDGTALYTLGDFIAADTADHHVQRADPETGCTCLAVLDAPIRLTGLASRLLNPLLILRR